jgi:subtilisin family serine protease
VNSKQVLSKTLSVYQTMVRRCIAGLLTGVALSVEGARISRRGSLATETSTKEILGVPVLNYNLAYGGRSTEGSEREHWVVVARAGASSKRLRQLCQRSGMCERVGQPSKGGFAFFEVYSTEKELEAILSLAPGEIEFVEPDGQVYVDPEEEVPTTNTASWGLGRVDVPNAFNTGAGANIYVLDTGIRVTHQDFGGRASPAIDMTSGSLVECDPTSTTCAGDAQGHGTHCAGTAGGSTYGVAPAAKIYSGKVLSDQGSGSWSWSYEALDWLATSAARPTIASMSLGGSGTQSAMRAAVDAAAAAGVTVVVAAGNSNSDACFFSPAFVPSAVTVGSTTSTDQRSSFSNYGSCVEIWAPGSDIVSASHRSNTGSTSLSGTSMACPHVSGGAALVLTENPGFTPSQVLAELTRRAELGVIRDLKATDDNVLLWVGSDPAPVPAPTPAPPPTPMCPDFAASRQPDRDGDCKCANNFACSRDRVNKNCPTSGAIGGYGGTYFFITCTDCRCYASLPA